MARPKNKLPPEPTEHNGQARCYFGGREHYFGKFGSPEARAKYEAFRAACIADPGSARPKVPLDDLLIATLVNDYFESDDCPTGRSSRGLVEQTIALLLEKHPKTAVTAFRVADLEAWQSWMCNLPHKKKPGERRYARSSVDGYVFCALRIWRWGVRKRGIPASLLAELSERQGPRHGQVREPRVVDPASPTAIAATLPFLSVPVRGAFQFQFATGCRPNEALSLTPGQIQRSGVVRIPGAGEFELPAGVWCYVPAKHKMRSRGKPRYIMIGPDVQAILAPFLDRGQHEYCFCPRESVGAKKANEKYSIQSYYEAVHDASVKAGSPIFPYQLRHTRAQLIAKSHPIESVMAQLGHHTKSESQGYAGPAVARAAELALLPLDQPPQAPEKTKDQ